MQGLVLFRPAGISMHHRCRENGRHSREAGRTTHPPTHRKRTSLVGSSRRLVASQSTCGALAAGMCVSFTARHVTVDGAVSCCVAVHTCCAAAPQRRTHSSPNCCSQ